jgi:DNA mismatch repair ATPase MutL
MEFLLRELLRTRTPFLCPHGRPIVLRLTDRALERTFGRC